MSVIGFSFTKFDCERRSAASKGSIEIKHNVTIDNVEKTSLNVGGGKSDVLKVDFSFDVLYGSSLGKITIKGDLIYTDTKEIIAETLKGWKADKKLNTTVNEVVYKFIYTKGIVKALELSDNLNLPAPIPIMPKGAFTKKPAKT